MSSDNLQESAQKGDLSAIASVIQRAFTNQKVQVDAEMQYGVTLWLKLKSDKTLDSQSCLNAIRKTLDNIKPEKVNVVRVSETSPKNPKQQVWNKYLGIKQGKFVDNTKQTNQISFAVCAVVISGLLYAGVTQKPTSTNASSDTPATTSSSSTTSTPSPSASASSTESRTFLGKSQTGYELWADKNCVYVEGITQADLTRLNTDVRGFKSEVKKQTGYTCVLFK